MTKTKRKSRSVRDRALGKATAVVRNPFEQKPSQERVAVDKGTPETRKKLKYDVIARLLKSGRITQRHFTAAQEIRIAWEAITFEGVRSIVSDYERVRVDGGRKSCGFVIAGMTDDERSLHETRYRPWQQAIGPILVHLPDREVNISDTLQIIMMGVTDNLAMEEIEERRHLPRGTASRVIRQGLELYCEMNGGRR